MLTRGCSDCQNGFSMLFDVYSNSKHAKEEVKHIVVGKESFFRKMAKLVNPLLMIYLNRVYTSHTCTGLRGTSVTQNYVDT